MDAQQFRTFVRDSIGELISPVEVTGIEESGTYGPLVLAETRPGNREVQLVPLFPGRRFYPIQVGSIGLALFAGADEGFYLDGAVIEGVIPDGWANDTYLIDAAGRKLQLRGQQGVELESSDGDVRIQGGGAGAARKGDTVRVRIDADATGGLTLQALALALLATGAFMPSGAPPSPTPPALPIDLTGEITRGSAHVLIGGGNG